MKTILIVASVYPLEDQKLLITGAIDYSDKSDSLKVLIQKVKDALNDNKHDKQADFIALQQ